jgi:hypothetical protein
MAWGSDQCQITRIYITNIALVGCKSNDKYQRSAF